MINRLALFASGSGTNVENIFNYFIGNNQIKVEIILCNNKDAVVLKRAKRLKIQYFLSVSYTHLRAHETREERGLGGLG